MYVGGNGMNLTIVVVAENSGKRNARVDHGLEHLLESALGVQQRPLCDDGVCISEINRPTMVIKQAK